MSLKDNLSFWKLYLGSTQVASIFTGLTRPNSVLYTLQKVKLDGQNGLTQI